MHSTYLLGFLLLAFVGESIARISRKNEAQNSLSSGDEKLSPVKINIEFTTDQLKELEKVLTDLYERYFGSPPEKLVLRRNDQGKSGLSKTISMIGDALCKHIKGVFNRFGISLTSRIGSLRSKFDATKSLKSSVYFQLLRFPLEIEPIWTEINALANNQMTKNNYADLGYKKTDFSITSNDDKSPKDSKILKTLESVKSYTEKLDSCLEENSTRASFDFKLALGKLTNFPPEMTSETLRKRLAKPLPKSAQSNGFTQIHALICHATVENSKINHQDCLDEIKRLDDCVNSKLDEKSSEKSDHRDDDEKTDFLRSIKNLDENCENIKDEKRCKLRSRIAKNDDFSYVVNYFAKDLKKSPVFAEMLDDFGSSVRKSRVGSDSLHEIVGLIDTYENGIDLQRNVMKSAVKDGRYESITKNLTEYKRHLGKMALRTVRNVNDIATNVEKILARSALKNSHNELSANVETLRCFKDIIHGIFGGWVQQRPSQSKPDNHKPINEIKSSRKSTSKGPIVATNVVGSVINSHDEPLKKLMNSMKHLGKATPPRRSSALISLANTFLLATMFYECIAVLAGAIYREDSGSLSSTTSAENDDDDHWSRDTRDLLSIINPQDHRNRNRNNKASSQRSYTSIYNNLSAPPSHNPERNIQNGENASDLVMTQTIVNKPPRNDKKATSKRSYASIYNNLPASSSPNLKKNIQNGENASDLVMTQTTVNKPPRNADLMPQNHVSTTSSSATIFWTAS